MKTILYKIIFPNNKLYFGITSGALTKRIKRGHFHDARRGSRLRVHRAIRKYGEKNIKYYSVVVGSREYIESLEILAIEKYKTRNPRFGYNVALGGSSSPATLSDVIEKMKKTKSKTKSTRSQKAREAHARPETKELHRKSIIEAHTRPETKEKHRNAVIGALSDPETKRKQTEARRLAEMRPEVKAREIESALRSWSDPAIKAARLAKSQSTSSIAKRTASAKITRQNNPVVYITNGSENKHHPLLEKIPEGWWPGMRQNHSGRKKEHPDQGTLF